MIQDRNRLYDFLLPWINRSWRRAYCRVEYHGLENIPKNAAVIFSPNHANTLMDAMAVLSLDNRRKVFVARADIFRKPAAARLLSFLKIMPIHRIRDGVESLRENDQVFDLSVRALLEQVPFCILPEGTHRPRHGLLPLKKGIARIALEAGRQAGDSLPVCIVPVGLEYEDYFRYRSRLLVNIGKPIVVQDFIKELGDSDPARQMHALLQRLERAMRELIICVPDEGDYDAIWDRANALYGENPADTLFLRKNRLQSLVDQVAEGPLAEARSLNAWRKRYGILTQSLAEPTGPAALSGQFLWLLLTFLIFAISTILMLPALLVTAGIRSRIKDRAWLNSVRFVCYTLLHPLLLTGTVLALSAAFPWWTCLFLFLWGLGAPGIVYDWWNVFCKAFSDTKALLKRHKK